LAMSLQTPTVIRTLQRKLYRQAKESKPPRRGRLRPELFSVCLTVKPVGEPDAGDRHVRFDERGWETERCRMAQATAPVLDSTEAADRRSVTSRQILRVERTCHGRRGRAESDPKLSFHGSRFGTTAAPDLAAFTSAAVGICRRVQASPYQFTKLSHPHGVVARVACWMQTIFALRHSSERTMSISRSMLLASFVALAAVTAKSPQAVAQQQRPNIIFIMGDDIGWSKIGVYNQGINRERTRQPSLSRTSVACATRSDFTPR
jgi:hypothetical protein